MNILGLSLLKAFKASHADARGPLVAWQESVERARWEGPQDIKRVYRSADFLAGNRVIFNIKGNRYRLVVQVAYVGGDVIIEWVGTHAEYTKRRF